MKPCRTIGIRIALTGWRGRPAGAHVGTPLQSCMTTTLQRRLSGYRTASLSPQACAYHYFCAFAFFVPHILDATVCWVESVLTGLSS